MQAEVRLAFGSGSGLKPRSPTPWVGKASRKKSHSPEEARGQESVRLNTISKLPDLERGAGFGDRAGRTLPGGQDPALCIPDPQPSLQVPGVLSPQHP